MKAFKGFRFDPRDGFEVLGLVVLIGLPYVGVKACEVGVEERGVFLN